MRDWAFTSFASLRLAEWRLAGYLGSMGDFEVFYSWQSDLPNRTNRGFVREALDRAAKQISAAPDVTEPVRVVSDTEGVPGSPNIVAAILNKIDSVRGMVADVSIVTGQEGGRPSPNPNVMFEVGYAAKSIGWSRIILVANTATGALEDLPFDFRGHRVVPYAFPDDLTVQPGALRGPLVGQLAARLAGILALGDGPLRYSDLIKQHWLPELDELRSIVREGLQAARRPSPPYYTAGPAGMVEDKRPGEFIRSLANPDSDLRERAMLFLSATSAFAKLWFDSGKALRKAKDIYGPELPDIKRHFASNGGPEALSAIETASDAVHRRIHDILT